VPYTPRGYRFYGWQTMLAEGLGVAAVAGAAGAGISGSRDGSIGLAGTVGGLLFVGGGFLVQAVHGKMKKAGGSLALTLGLPGTGALIGLGAGAARCADKGCRERAAGWGALVGVLATPLVDGLALGWEKKRDTRFADRPGAGIASVEPVAISVGGGVALGVGGTLF
jgi:hypothetical protein